MALSQVAEASIALEEGQITQTQTGKVKVDGDKVIFTELKKVPKMRHLPHTPAARPTRTFTIGEGAQAHSGVATTITFNDGDDLFIIAFVPKRTLATV